MEYHADPGPGSKHSQGYSSGNNSSSLFDSPDYNRTDGHNKQSPAKTVAGAIKKFFRMSSGDKLQEKQATTPTGNISPSKQQPGQLQPGRTLSKDHPKPASFKHQSSFEHPSVLDSDDRLTDRSSILTATTDRISAITDRNSIISSDRNSNLTASQQGDRHALSQAQRSSSSSRLGAYIRNIIKPDSTSTSPVGTVGQQEQPVYTSSAQQTPQPAQPIEPRRSSNSPTQQSSPTSAAAAAAASAAAANKPAIMFRNLPSSSTAMLLQAAPVSTSPRGMPDNTILPPPSQAALLRMQRDPNLLTVCNDLPPAMDRPSWRVEDYTLLQKIHSGYASAVFKAFCRLSNQTVALKVYQPAKLHEISQFQLYREARLHCQMNHPNIIKLYAAFRHGESVVLVQEYADGGDLLQLLMQHGTRLSERRSTQLVLQPLLRALYYLHSRSIVHRDIKLENILFTGREMTLKLADFGLCLNLREERSVTRAGTLDYMAPEVLRCPQKHKPQDNKDRLDLAYNMSVDIWALGVVAYELLNGCPPFTCHDKKETEKRISSGLMPEFVVDVTEAAQEFVYTCLARMPEHRPTAWQLLRSPWLKSGHRSSIPTTAMMGATAYASANAGVAALHVTPVDDEPEQPPPAPTPATRQAAMSASKGSQSQIAAEQARVAAPTPTPPNIPPITAANYAPGRVAAAYAQSQQAVENALAGITGPQSSPRAGSASTKSSQPLLPTSQLVQQQQLTGASGSSASTSASVRHNTTRTSAPAASAIKALYTQMQQADIPAGLVLPPPAGLAQINTESIDKKDSKSSSNTPSSVTATSDVKSTMSSPRTPVTSPRSGAQ